MYHGSRFGKAGDRVSFHEIAKERMQIFKELHLIAIIVSRSKSKKVIDILRTKRMPGQYVFYAKGSATSSIMDMMGLGSEAKMVILGLAASKSIPHLFSELEKEIKLTKSGTGIAFSLPLSGLVFPPLARDREMLAKWQEGYESGVEQMDTNLTHDLIVVIVDEGRSEEVMDAARKVGATGGTIFNALHFGMQDAARFFGIPMQQKKEIVTILCKRENKLDILSAVNEALGRTQKIIFSMPADNVIGLDMPEAE